MLGQHNSHQFVYLKLFSNPTLNLDGDRLNIQFDIQITHIHASCILATYMVLCDQACQDQPCMQLLIFFKFALLAISYNLFYTTNAGESSEAYRKYLLFLELKIFIYNYVDIICSHIVDLAYPVQSCALTLFYLLLAKEFSMKQKAFPNPCFFRVDSRQ